MRPFRTPLTMIPAASGQIADHHEPGPGAFPGPVTRHSSPQVLFAGESLTQALRQLALYGRDGLPVLAADGQHLQGWITTQNVLRAIQRHVSASPAATAEGQLAAEWGRPDPGATLTEPPDPLTGYQLLEVTITPGSPAVGRTLQDTAWPPGAVPVSILTSDTLRNPDPATTLTPGDRINLLTPQP